MADKIYTLFDEKDINSIYTKPQNTNEKYTQEFYKDDDSSSIYEKLNNFKPTLDFNIVSFYPTMSTY